MEEATSGQTLHGQTGMILEQGVQSLITSWTVATASLLASQPLLPSRSDFLSTQPPERALDSNPVAPIVNRKKAKKTLLSQPVPGPSAPHGLPAHGSAFCPLHLGGLSLPLCSAWEVLSPGPNPAGTSPAT